jgi:hypothetical protein
VSDIRIDAYMLTLDEPPEWRQAALESLRGAEINLHVIPTDRGTTIGADMAHHFAQGSSPYAVILDPDNLYEPTAFAQLADALDQNTAAGLAYTDETVMDAQAENRTVRNLAYSRYAHAHSPSLVHSLVVYRRCAAREHLESIATMHVYAEWMLTLHITKSSPVVHLPIIGRHWRQHPRQAHLKSGQTEIDAIRRELRTRV